jgi:hypothetical protein
MEHKRCPCGEAYKRGVRHIEGTLKRAYEFRKKL